MKSGLTIWHLIDVGIFFCMATNTPFFGHHLTWGAVFVLVFVTLIMELIFTRSLYDRFRYFLWKLAVKIRVNTIRKRHAKKFKKEL